MSLGVDNLPDIDLTDTSPSPSMHITLWNTLGEPGPA